MIKIQVGKIRDHFNMISDGVWISLPCDDLQKRLDSIAWDEKQRCFLDITITNGKAPFFVSGFDDPHEVNEKAKRLEEVWVRLTFEEVKAALEVMNVDELLGCYQELTFVEGQNYSDLGVTIADEHCLLEKYDEFIHRYFDYDSFGRDLVLGGDFRQANDYFVSGF